MHIRPLLRLSSLALLTLLLSVSALSQRAGRFEAMETNLDSYYNFSQPGARTVQIQVVGAVTYPGLYEVREGTTLQQVLALSAPEMPPRFRFNPRKVDIQVIRPSWKEDTPIYDERLRVALANPQNHPDLFDGDAILIEVVDKQGLSWRDAVAVANAIGILILVIDRTNSGS